MCMVRLFTFKNSCSYSTDKLSLILNISLRLINTECRRPFHIKEKQNFVVTNQKQPNKEQNSSKQNADVVVSFGTAVPKVSPFT